MYSSLHGSKHRFIVLAMIQLLSECWLHQLQTNSGKNRNHSWKIYSTRKLKSRPSKSLNSFCRLFLDSVYWIQLPQWRQVKKKKIRAFKCALRVFLLLYGKSFVVPNTESKSPSCSPTKNSQNIFKSRATDTEYLAVWLNIVIQKVCSEEILKYFGF